VQLSEEEAQWMGADVDESAKPADDVVEIEPEPQPEAAATGTAEGGDE
jgi:hypothetical protein